MSIQKAEFNVELIHGGFYKVLHGKIKALNLESLAKPCNVLECQPGDLLALIENNDNAKRKKNE